MAFLAAAVAVVGAISVLNLLLTTAVIRRLRRDEAARRVPEIASGPTLGSPLPAFAAVAMNGEQVTSAALAGRPAIFGFFSTTCAACAPSISRFLEHAGRDGLKPSQVVAVIGGQVDDAGELLTELGTAATVVMEPRQGPLTSAFSVLGFPTFVIIDADGIVERAGPGLASLTRTA